MSTATKTKHTPGPWAWDELCEEIRSATGRTVITAKFVVQDPDVNLIAAAPAMLEALEAVEREGYWNVATRDLCQAAIRLAKGESHV